MRKHAGFTLIELLVVIALIAILASMSLVVVANYLHTAQVARTRVTIAEVDTLLSSRAVAFQRMLNSPQFDRQVDALMRAAPPGHGLQRRAFEVLVAKRMQRLRFPQRFADVPGFVVPPNHDPMTESSEMLYYQLTAIKVETEHPVGPESFDGAVADTDGDGLPELVDGWGQPLRFYRWPTRLIRPDGDGQPTTPSQYRVAQLLIHALPVASVPDPALVGSQQALLTAADLYLDPDDRFRSLTQSLPNAWFRSQWNETEFHTRDTWHDMLVVSPGEDGDVGLYEPFDVARGGHLAMPTPDTLSGISEATADNLTNLQAGF